MSARVSDYKHPQKRDSIWWARFAVQSRQIAVSVQYRVLSRSSNPTNGEKRWPGPSLYVRSPSNTRFQKLELTLAVTPTGDKWAEVCVGPGLLPDPTRKLQRAPPFYHRTASL
jgi:hypothetical protein